MFAGSPPMLYSGDSGETVFRSRPRESSPISVSWPPAPAYAVSSFSAWSMTPTFQSSSSHGPT